MFPEGSRWRWVAIPIAGALQTLTFSPINAWWLGPVSLLLLLAACLNLPRRRLALAGWVFGLGLFGSGASWVYVSIHTYGMTSAPLAVLLTTLFVAGLSLFPAFGFWCWSRLAREHLGLRLLVFPAIWILTDWLRGWLLTGFPWLYLGTGQVDGPLAGWAPVTGVHGVTLLIAGSAVLAWIALDQLRQRARARAGAFLVLALLPWLAGPALLKVDWVTTGDRPVSFVTIQGNIPQIIKWDPAHLQDQLHTYLELTRPHWGKDLVLWPETAIPIPSPQAGGVIGHLEQTLEASGGTLVSGIPWYGFSPHQGRETFHNSMLALGDGSGYYHKQRLVPFGEYVPLESVLRGLIAFFNLPMSSFTRGPEGQDPLQVGPHRVMPFICYEVAYADFVARQARGTDYLLTVSNDAWFGRSFGPLQHLQIARMRALETARYLLRGTNNGVTALIGPRGQVIKRAPRFQRAHLEGELYPVTGATPFMRTGSWPVLGISLLLIALALGGRQRRD